MDTMWMMLRFYSPVCEFVLHLATDCIDYIRRFYSFCLDAFTAPPRFWGCSLVAVMKTKHR